MGSGGTGDMVWKYGVADDVDDIAINVFEADGLYLG
jgi:hypothetical protein